MGQALAYVAYTALIFDRMSNLLAHQGLIFLLP